MNYFKLFFSKNSILRDFQKFEFSKMSIIGASIEFGAEIDHNKNFLKSTNKNYICDYSNIKKQSKSFIQIDLEKNNFRKLRNKYDNAIIFNVLEHLVDINKALQNIKKILKKNGTIIGSTPFLYRVHGAPEDHYRYTKENLMLTLKKNGYNKIFIKELGTGPFLASFSLLRSYLKYFFIFYDILLLCSLLADSILRFFMNTDPKIIYPIGYFFVAKKNKQCL